MYLGFQWYAANSFRIPVVRRNFIWDSSGGWLWVVGGAVVGCVEAREETQPANCVAASRLCRHSAQTCLCFVRNSYFSLFDLFKLAGWPKPAHIARRSQWVSKDIAARNLFFPEPVDIDLMFLLFADFNFSD